MTIFLSFASFGPLSIQPTLYLFRLPPIEPSDTNRFVCWECSHPFQSIHRSCARRSFIHLFIISTTNQTKTPFKNPFLYLLVTVFRVDKKVYFLECHRLKHTHNPEIIKYLFWSDSLLTATISRFTRFGLCCWTMFNTPLGGWRR